MYEIWITNGQTRERLRAADASSDSQVIAAEFDDPIADIVFPSASFEVIPMNPAYDRLHELTTVVEYVNTLTGECEFLGRIAHKPKDGMAADGTVSKQYECEGLIAYLSDSRQMYRTYNGITPHMFIASLLYYHNLLHPDKAIQIGSCDVSTSFNAVTQYRTTLEELRANLTDRFGGEMRLRRDQQGVLRLDYLHQLGNRQNTVIELGRNLVSVNHTADARNIITRLIPLGKALSNDSPERLTLAGYYQDAPDKYWIDADSDTQQTYGIIEGTAEFDDIETQAELYTKGTAYLAENNRIKKSYTAEVLDLSTIGADAQALRAGNTYRFKCSFTGLDEDLRLTKRHVDIVNKPYKPSVEIGDKTVKLSSAQARTARLLEYAIPQQRYSIMAATQDMIDGLMNGGLASNVICDGHEVLIMDTDDESTASNIWKINTGGIAHRGSDGQYNLAMLMDGKVVADFVLAGSVTAENLTVTGGTININASAENYDVIQLNYENQQGHVWHSHSSPLEFDLSNTGIGKEWKAQAGSMFFYENGNTASSFSGNALTFYSGANAAALLSGNSMNFYDSNGVESSQIHESGIKINASGSASNAVVQIYRDSLGNGNIMGWSAGYGKWLSLNDLEARVQALEARI